MAIFEGFNPDGERPTETVYVMYLRKSTRDESKQERSIEDQRKDCERIVKDRNLKWNKDDTIIETESAKTPDQRPLFKKMLSDIREGKYQGIIAWNPDRLARNMREGGEIIDMIDSGLISDLQFPTHHFTNDPNGKMLLGMAFVLSKQYSDALSQRVTRGVRNKFAEGKVHREKYGYKVLDSRLVPDGKNFDLISKAWRMRLEGQSLEAIANFLAKEGYVKTLKNGAIKHITPQILSRLFKDPIYYGVLISKKTAKEVLLAGSYDFKPIITKDEYDRVQMITKSIHRPNKTKGTFYPFKRFLICGYCGNYLLIGPSTSGSKTKKVYLRTRCDSGTCPQKGWGMRTKVIIEFIAHLLTKIKFGPDEYKLLKKSYPKYSDRKLEEMNNEHYSLTSRLETLQNEAKRLFNSHTTTTSKKMREKIDAEYEENGRHQAEVVSKIEKLKALRQKAAFELPTLEEFLNFSKQIAPTFQSSGASIKDAIARNLFLNLKLEKGKVASYQLKQPYDVLVRNSDFSLSRDEGT